jgi:hypothetical protein
MAQLKIYHPNWRAWIVVPAQHQRRCSICKDPMTLDHYHYQTETVVSLKYLCNKKDHARIKIVIACVDKKGGFSC